MTYKQAVTNAEAFFAPYTAKGGHVYMEENGNRTEEGLLDEAHILRVSLQFDGGGNPRPPHFHVAFFLLGWHENAYTGCRVYKVIDVTDGDYGTRRFRLDNGATIDLAPPADEDIEAAVAVERKRLTADKRAAAHRDYVLAELRDRADRWEEIRR